MAFKLLSQIPLSVSPPALNESLVGVNAAVLDRRYTWQQLSAKPPNIQTASYTLVLTDFNGIVAMNVGAANNLTIPLNATVPFPLGTLIQVVQTGAGQTTFVAAAGVNLLSPGSAVNIVSRYSWASLYQYTLDTWLLQGGII